MVVTGARVSGVADVGDDLALFHEIAFGQTICVAREMSVIKDQILVCVELIDRCATFLALEELNDLAVCGSQDGSFSRRHNVDRVMYAAFGACVVESVDQLFWFNSGNGDDEIRAADEVGT